MNATPVEEEVNELEVNFKQVKNDTVIRITDAPLDPERVPANASLLAVSDTYGYVIIGVLDGILYGSTNSLLHAYQASANDAKTLYKPRRRARFPAKDGAVVRQVALSSDELVVLVAYSNGDVFAIETSSLEYTDKISMIGKVQLKGELAYLLPNPEVYGNVCAAVMTDGRLLLFDIKPTSTTPTVIDLKGEHAICASWSRKGKQLMCGMRSGLLCQYTPAGEMKRQIARPPSLAAPTAAVLWLETNVILAVYAPGPDANGEVDDATKHEYSVYLLSLAGKGMPWHYRKLPDPCPPWGMLDRSSHYYMSCLKDWSASAKNIVCVASSPSTDIGVIGEPSHGTDGWHVWLPADESDRAALPLPPDSMDTAPIGLAVSPISLDGPDAMDWPLMIVYTIAGTLVCYHVIDTKQAENEEKCELLRPAQPLPNATGGASVVISTKDTVVRPAAKPASTPAKLPLPPPPASTIGKPSARLSDEYYATLSWFDSELQLLFNELNASNAFIDDMAQSSGAQSLPMVARYIQNHAHQLDQHIGSLRQAILDEEADVNHLGEGIPYVEGKSTEIKYWLKSHDSVDRPGQPQLAEQLDPVFVDSEQALRKKNEFIEYQLNEIESWLQAQYSRDQSSTSIPATRPPALQAVYQTIENISTAARRQLDSIDQLAQQLDQLSIINAQRTRPASSYGDSGGRLALGAGPSVARKRHLRKRLHGIVTTRNEPQHACLTELPGMKLSDFKEEEEEEEEETSTILPLELHQPDAAQHAPSLSGITSDHENPFD
ncbi:hypothetical protein SYNPS1DRAFT_22408, partial [Syncephalis pseudoplumigaleata]